MRRQSPFERLAEKNKRLLPLAISIGGACTICFFLGSFYCGLREPNVGPRPHTFVVNPPIAFKPCTREYQDFTPCTDPSRWSKHAGNTKGYAARERHCPPKQDRLQCLVPPPPDYKDPIRWPESLNTTWYSNVPYDWIDKQKSNQHWVERKDDKFIFPGGGTMFPHGVGVYVDNLQEVLPPLKDGTIRTALDTGCGVASWGGDLLHRGVLPLSFAPKDNHEAQIQFALERGIPAMLGVIATQRLPYPSRAFDMAHCSRCLIPWSANGGLYLTEIARILRPGGFWVLSGPPVNYQQRWRGWETTEEEQRQDLEKLRDTMKSLCFTLYKLEGDFAIWQKPTTNECHNQKKQDGSQPAICDTEAYPADDAWYVPMEPCVTPFPDNYVSTPLRQWSERLNAIPPRILESKDESAAAFQHDVKKWQERVEFYKTVVGELGSNKIRNVMDMNAGYGSFAAALIDMPVWTMNVVSTYGMNTLGAVFDRGLIGTYHDWCEAFSTYPRTYDMLHAAGLFSAEGHRCELTDVMLEMDRILRPNGVVIVRDLDYVVERVANAAKLMRWNCQSFSDDHRSVASEEVLVCRKEFWTI